MNLNETPCRYCRYDPATVLGRTDNFLVFYCRLPMVPGHTVVVPLRHNDQFISDSDEWMAEWTKLMDRTTRRIGRTFGIERFEFRVLRQRQDNPRFMPHTQLHIIPQSPKIIPDWYQQIANQPHIPTHLILEHEQLTQITHNLRSIRA